MYIYICIYIYLYIYMYNICINKHVPPATVFPQGLTDKLKTALLFVRLVSFVPIITYFISGTSKIYSR